MMIRYVALLRGIGPSNPNMRNDKLRGVFDSLGFENVQSVISSGNVVFDSSESNAEKLESRIEKALPQELGFHSTTIIRTQSELQRIVNARPFSSTPDVPASRLNVTFLKENQANMPNVPYKHQDNAYRVFRIDGKSLGVVVNTTLAKTPDVMGWLEKEFSKDITTRTWKTVGRILKRMET